MKAATPPPPQLVEFLLQNESTLSGIPQQIYSLSMQAEQFEAFEWALENGAKLNIHYTELLKFWAMGSVWRDYILAEHSETALPVFMDEAIKGYDVRFFREHVAEFKTIGFKTHRFMSPIEFNTRLIRYMTERIERAMEKGSRERVVFLVDNMPPRPSGTYVEEGAAEIRRELGDYALYTLEDEELFCKLIKMGYDHNQINLSNSIIGERLLAALRAHPKSAIRAVGLDEWSGKMTKIEFDFLNSLPETQLDSLDQIYVNESIELSMAGGDEERTRSYIVLSMQRKPFTQGDYEWLINLSLKYGSRMGIDYVKEHSGEIDIFTFDLASLAENQDLFVRYAPEIMKKVYSPMDTQPRKDGTTLGRIYEAFTASNEQAGLYIVTRYDLAKVWVKTTEGRTLLMDICRAGNLAATRFLIEERGADIHVQTGYQKLEVNLFGRIRPTEGKLTPIFFAAQSGNTELIKYISEKSFDGVNARSNFGATPLMHAVSAGHLDAVKMLIDLGAKVNAEMSPDLNNGIDTNEMGAFYDISNAYRRAKSGGHTEILAILQQAGARP